MFNALHFLELWSFVMKVLFRRVCVSQFYLSLVYCIEFNGTSLQCILYVKTIWIGSYLQPFFFYWDILSFPPTEIMPIKCGSVVIFIIIVSHYHKKH